MGNLLILPYPLSTNRLWRTVNGRQVLSREGREWKSNARLEALMSDVTKLIGPVAVSLVLHPKLTTKGEPMKRRIDLDNAIKATLDILNGLGWEDDSQIVKLSAEVGKAVLGGAVSVSYTAAGEPHA